MDKEDSVVTILLRKITSECAGSGLAGVGLGVYMPSAVGVQS